MHPVAQANSSDSTKTGREKRATRKYYRHFVAASGSRYLDEKPM
jgi:hypothetical protein